MPQKKPTSAVFPVLLVWLAAIVTAMMFFLWSRGLLTRDYPSPDPLAGQSLSQPEQSSSFSGPARPPQPQPLPAWNSDQAPYLITAFSLQGMQHVTDAEPLFRLLAPGNTLVAQVIRRSPTPYPQSPAREDGPTTVRYVLEQREDPAMAPDGGPGSGLLGGVADSLWFTNESIPVMPYLAVNATAAEGSRGGMFYPYPTARLAAADPDGAVLAETRVVLPVSTEIGCKNCHTGPWKYQDTSGISAQTAGNILEVHDRRNNTNLIAEADRGAVVDCRACHTGAGETPNISAAVHGFHATMKLEGPEACGRCHPSGQEGATKFYRDFHALWGLDCSRCHGGMAEHALTLLRYESDRGSGPARARQGMLEEEFALKGEDFNPRKPWVNLPQCAGCHDFTSKPDPATASAFNKWTENKNERFVYAVENTGKLRCPSCHGSPHAVYPASGPAGDDDNAQPLQYQHEAAPLGKGGNCAVCHTIDMEYFIHHDRVD